MGTGILVKPHLLAFENQIKPIVKELIYLKPVKITCSQLSQNKKVPLKGRIFERYLFYIRNTEKSAVHLQLVQYTLIFILTLGKYI